MKRFLSLMCLVLLLVGVAQPASAFWPFGGDDDQPKEYPAIEPLDKDWKERHCEPLRQEAIRLNQTMASWNPWREIRVSRLKIKHRKCISEFEDHEYDYLKGESIEKDG